MCVLCFFHAPPIRGTDGHTTPQLDPVHLSSAVVGDEQFFDVELDRNTDFLPIPEGGPPPTDLLDFASEDTTTDNDDSNEKADPGQPFGIVACGTYSS